MPDDGLRIRDHVIAQMVTCEPEKSEMSAEEQAFRAGYALGYTDYDDGFGRPAKISEDQAWRDWSAHKD